ncbi:MAG TPA: hypothetical protein VHB30_09315, partial [Solirubrobacteraceae bacterium]|nr:hypothetical protein [Solirubrobacteraceae bacterium]
MKSPPELWAEISDATSLARHLGELGEIRITRVEPETTIDWEADRATGSVSIAASGWGTRVTLVAEPTEPPEPPAASEAEPEPEPPKPTAPATQADGAWRPFVAAAPVAKPAKADVADVEHDSRAERRPPQEEDDASAEPEAEEPEAVAEP